jgi:hypothetical protein
MRTAMLFDAATLAGLADGTITLAFRRWERARVKPGGRQHTAVGVVAFDAVDQVEPARISAAEARAAGYRDRPTLLEALDRRGEGPTWRIRLHLHGPDPRVALRDRADLDDAELGRLRARLSSLDAASTHGPWTIAVLELLAERPATRAAELAAAQGRETQPFKRDVRKLKNLGLTESLEIGYRLSPRGRAVLERLKPSRPAPPGPSG